MDSTTAGLDFAAIGHQDSWKNIGAFVNSIRTTEMEKLSDEKVKASFSYIPPRDVFRVKVKSSTGIEINGAYIETFIDPDKLDNRFIKTNISKVMQALAWAEKMGAGIATLGGFTSILLEGNLNSFSSSHTKFTTGNTLTAAYIVKGIEKAAAKYAIDIKNASILIVGATGDIGTACVQYFKHKAKKLLLCGRNIQRLENLSAKLLQEGVHVQYADAANKLTADADIVICVASTTGMQLGNYKKTVLICDAGYPKNLENNIEGCGGYLFHGGMGQVSSGYSFNPDYSTSMYHYPAPFVIHGCILEAMVLAFEKKFESYSSGKGNITVDKMEEIYQLAIKHGIDTAPFFNEDGLWQ